MCVREYSCRRQIGRRPTPLRRHASSLRHLTKLLAAKKTVGETSSSDSGNRERQCSLNCRGIPLVAVFVARCGEAPVEDCLSWTTSDNPSVSLTKRIFQTHVCPSAQFGLEYMPQK